MSRVSAFDPLQTLTRRLLRSSMRATRGILALAVVLVVAAVAALYLFDRYSESGRREAFIYHCNEEGAGGMLTSREYCEELYERSTKKR